MVRRLAALTVSTMLLVVSSGCRPSRVTLDTLPEWSELDDGICALRPLESARGSLPLPVEANPFVATDQRVIRFLSIWVLPRRNNDEELESYDEASFEREVQLIEAVYVAVFESLPGAPEPVSIAFDSVNRLWASYGRDWSRTQ